MSLIKNGWGVLKPVANGGQASFARAVMGLSASSPPKRLA